MDSFDSGIRAYNGRGEVAPGRPAGAAISAANLVLRHRRLLVLSVLLATGIMSGLALTRERTYTTSAAFMPQAPNSSLAGISSFAAQFGVNVGKEDQTQSPDFYAEVIRSRDLLNALAVREYTVRTTGGEVTAPLPDLLEVEGDTPEQRMEKTIRELRGMIFTRITRATRVIHLSVSTPYPDLSQQLAEGLLAQLDEFNSHIRQSRASAEERFLEEREQEARQAHTVAEQRLVSFLQRNMNYSSSAALSHEYGRLSRESMHRAEVVSSLAQARTQARIEAARNTPVITVIDTPSRAVRPDSRGLLRTGILAMAAGLLIGLVLALAADAFRRQDDEDETNQFLRLQAEARADLRRPWRVLLPRREGERIPAELS
jgi:uncharacterized protein involved in exopolysaccharide biosynthesis